MHRKRRLLTLIVLILIIIGALGLLISSGSLPGSRSEIEQNAPNLVYMVILLAGLMAAVVASPPRLHEIVRAIAIWGGLLVVLIGGYAFRHDLEAVGQRMLAALLPGMVVEGPTGSVSVGRDSSGHFRLNGTVNGASVRFLVDTGATSVVLTAEDARAAGFPANTLSYSVPVSTANGRALVAPIQLQEIRLGSIRLGHVRALAARPGDLDTSLLGMSALSRLSSWRVEGDRLVLVP